MSSPRYTLLLANRNTGVVRRFNFVRRPVVLGAFALLAVPTLVGLGARWAGQAEIDTLKVTNESLRLENENYRAATGELATQISSLQEAITDLSQQAELDPATRQAIERLPAVVKARAMGGSLKADPTGPAAKAVADSPETTLGILKDLLGVLEDRMTSVRKGVEGRQALAAATPSIWPLTGWLTSNFGKRKDPLDGSPDFHPGLDISADRGTPVHATADGVVELSAHNGNYGNSIEISHGYGISTRFGHLSSYAVRKGSKIHRGDVIGYVGSTGRTTGSHLHYEILLNGQPMDPLKFLGWR
jgi:murein DD-endopeptidase MepM/ murein hydrolase activator NlpD